MKNIWAYLLGVLTGIIVTIGAFFVLYILGGDRSSDITFFDEPGKVITAQTFTGETVPVKGFEVFQVLDDGAALATGNEFYDRDLVVLLWNDDGMTYYDNQEVTAPRGKCFRQIGIFKYQAKNGNDKAVPVVALMEGSSNNVDGMSFYDEPGEVMSDKSFKVTRVLDTGVALARGKNEYGSLYYGLEVVLWDDEMDFYDDQIVKAPNGQSFRKVGIYKDGRNTYPIVSYKKSGFPGKQ